MTVPRIIETYTGRWNIETTFQGLRAYLGVETTRGWSRNKVLRVAPCLFGLYTVVALLYAELPARYTRGFAGGGLAWQARCNVLGRYHGGSALVVGGVGFCNPRSSRSLFKTQGPIPANRAQWASSGGIRPPDGPLAEARGDLEAIAARPRDHATRGTRGTGIGRG